MAQRGQPVRQGHLYPTAKAAKAMSQKGALNQPRVQYFKSPNSTQPLPATISNEIAEEEEEEPHPYPNLWRANYGAYTTVDRGSQMSRGYYYQSGNDNAS